MQMHSRARAVALTVSALALSAAMLPSCAPAGEGAAPVLTTQLALRDELRQRFSLEATWTRDVIVSSFARLEDLPAASARLDRSTAEIADSFRRFYGDQTASELAALLQGHVRGLEGVIAATLAADNDALEAATAAWYANADDTARFLADLNDAWSYYELWRLFSAQIERAIAETRARASRDFEGDVVAQDGLVTSSRAIADELTMGIAEQLPQLVASQTFMSVTERDLHVSQRVLWEDHASWMRFFIIDLIAGLSSAPETTSRLLANQDEIGDAITQLFGSATAQELTTLLHQHVEGAAAVVAALASGDADATARARSAWYANASELARFYGSLGEQGSLGDLEGAFHMHVDVTQQEMIARLASDWDTDVLAYDVVEAHVLHLSDLLATTQARDLAAIAPVPAAAD